MKLIRYFFFRLRNTFRHIKYLERHVNTQLIYSYPYGVFIEDKLQIFKDIYHTIFVFYKPIEHDIDLADQIGSITHHAFSD